MQQLAAVTHRLERSNTLDPAELSSQEQRRLYEELPFTVLPGMRSASIKRTRSENQLNMIASKLRTRVGSVQGEEQPLIDMQLAPDLMNEVELTAIEEPGFTGPLLRSSCIALLTTFAVGYNTGVVNAAANVTFPGKTTWSWSLAVSIFALGAPFGAMAGGKLADRIGRKSTLLLNAVLYIIAGLIMALAPNMAVFTAGRAVVGVACGVGTVLVSLYLAELAPPNLRGTLGTFNQFSTVIEGNTGTGIDRWRFLLGFTALPALLQILAAPLLYESPRWYLMRAAEEGKRRRREGKEQVSASDHLDEQRMDSSYRQKAVRVLQLLRGQVYVDEEVDAIMVVSMSETKDVATLRELISDPTTLFVFCIAMGLQVAQQLTGINAVMFYSTTFFQSMHFANPLVGTCVVSTVNVIGTACAIPLMDTAGRRPLLLLSSLGMFLSLIVVTAALNLPSLTGANTVALVGVNAYVFLFELGMGPIPWLIVAEMFPSRQRATAVSIATSLNWGCNFLVAQFYPVMNATLHGYSMLPFAGMLVVVLICTCIYVHETKGKTVEEIRAEIQAKVK